MKLTKILGVAAVAALALMAFASTASATTLEVGGVAKNESITITASLEAGSSALLTDTSHFFANTCTASSVEGKTEGTFTGGATVGGKISALTFSTCTEEPVVVDEKGSLTVERIGTTTNGTVRSTGAKVTSPSPFGPLTCTTNGTDIGTLTGVKSTTEHATMDIKAVLNCGFFLPSALWEGSYKVTSPTGLGVTG